MFWFLFKEEEFDIWETDYESHEVPQKVDMIIDFKYWYKVSWINIKKSDCDEYLKYFRESIQNKEAIILSKWISFEWINK